MNRLTKWTVAVVIGALLASPAFAADAIFRGKVKSTTPDKNEFVVEDGNNKSVTFVPADNFQVNRGGKDSKFADLKIGDEVSICYETGLLKGTAHYVLVHEGDSKTWEVGRGSIKSYDAAKGEMALTDLNKKEWTFMVPLTSKVQINSQAAKLADVKVGEMMTVVYETKDGKYHLVYAVVQRK